MIYFYLFAVEKWYEDDVYIRSIFQDDDSLCNIPYLCILVWHHTSPDKILVNNEDPNGDGILEMYAYICIQNKSYDIL